MTVQKFGYGFDWRGVPLFPGQTVIYGAGVGRSIAMVEAEVVKLYWSKGYGPEPKVKLKVIRRAYGGSSTEFVNVGQDRVTVIEKLPPSALTTTVGDEVAAQKKREQERKDCQATHDLKKEPKSPKPSDYCQEYHHSGICDEGKHPYNTHYRADYNAHQDAWRAWYDAPCNRCNLGHYETTQSPCPGRTSVI